MAKPFTFSTKRAGGNIYVQFTLPDGGRTFQKSTGTSIRKEAEKIAMEWLVNGNIPECVFCQQEFLKRGFSGYNKQQVFLPPFLQNSAKESLSLWKA